MNVGMRNEGVIAVCWKVMDFDVNSRGNKAIWAHLLMRCTSCCMVARDENNSLWNIVENAVVPKETKKM